MTALTGVGVSVNNGSLLPCELHWERDTVDVSTAGSKPDEAWSMVDAAGHFHAYNRAAKHPREQYPTLTVRSTRHPCAADHDDGDVCGDDEDCGGGWTESWYECAICEQRITPGTIPGPHHDVKPGLFRWWVEVRLPEPTNAHRVSVRVVSGEHGWFGVAGVQLGRVCGVAVDDGVVEVGEGWSYVLHGVGPLGTWKGAQAPERVAEVPKQRTGEDPEIQAMHAIAEAFAGLDPVTAERVAHWVFDRYTLRANEGDDA